MLRTVGVDLIIPIYDKIVLIKRGKEPFKGMLALPGGRVENETVTECAIREGKEETGLELRVRRLIGVFSTLDRDPRKIISVALEMEVTGGSLKAGDDATEVLLLRPEEALRVKLAFDHAKIIKAWLSEKTCILDYQYYQ